MGMCVVVCGGEIVVVVVINASERGTCERVP